MRILHVDTERGWRGGERQALWLARELARRGHRSVVAARGGEPLAERAADAGLTVVDCSPANEADLLAAWRLRRAIREDDIEIVHAHAAHAVAVARIATIGSGVPLVVSRRVDFPLRNNAGTRWKYGGAARIIAISRAVAAVLERGGVAAERIDVVPDGVDIHRAVAPATRETLAHLGVPPGTPLAVQVSQLVGHKDPLTFVRAVDAARQRVPTLHALLVGDGPLRDDVDAEIRARSLEGVVHRLGYRTDADALLAAADVACLSSREEGMGSVLLDALAFGVPIAATTAGGIPEVVVHGECGLLAAPRDGDALGAAIAKLLEDGALRARFAAAGRERAREFSVERMTERTLAIYDSVSASSRGGGRRSRTDPASSSSSA